MQPTATGSMAPVGESDELTITHEPVRRTMTSRARAKVATAIAIAIVGGFDLLFHLGAADWSVDELIYRASGWAAFHGGGFLSNASHPPLAKHIIGVFEIAFGQSRTPVRFSAVVAAMLTGVFLALIARRIAGDWAALVTAAVWFALPHAGDFKLERYALLDVFMAMFTALAILFALRWRDAQQWSWAIASGVAAGLATACKLPGALVLVPIAVFMLAIGRFSTRSVQQLAATGAASLAGFVGAYVPALAQMPHQVRYMVDFQTQQRKVGHPTVVAGHLYVHPPWWTVFRWQWDASWILTIGYVVALGWVIAMIAKRRDPELALLFGFVLINVAFFSFVSGNVLPHYSYAWAPGLAVLTGLVVHDLARRGGSARGAALLLALALAIPAVQLAVRTAHLEPTDYSVAGPLIRETVGPTASVVLVGDANVLHAYVPGLKLLPDKTTEPASAEVIDPTWSSRGGRAWKSRYLSTHPGALTVHRIGRLLVYLPS